MAREAGQRERPEQEVASHYRRIGNFLVPRAPASQSWYWRHLHHLQRLPRYSTLMRWRGSSWQDLPWADALQPRLEATLGAPLQCIWRPAAPGISRASLGWTLRDGNLQAMVRVACGPHCAFLEREWRALCSLVSVSGLAATTPHLLYTERRLTLTGELSELLLIESACSGAAVEPRRAAAPAAAAADWLAGFQVAAGTQGCWSSDALMAALANAARLTPQARQHLRVRALAAPLLPGVCAHSDFWWGNVLLGEGGAIAVVDWSEFRREAHPFHDAGFYLLTWGRDWVQSRQRLQLAHWRQLGRALSAGGRTLPGIEARTPSDQPERPEQKVASHWLRQAFAPDSRFLPMAEAWFARYRAALSRATWSASLEFRFDAFLRHLPLVMAHYACYGQQAAAWSAACNAWAESENLVF